MSVPGYSTDVLQWVELVARAHGGRGVRKVPDEYFGLTGPRSQEVGLKGVHVKSSYSTSVLGGLGNKSIGFRAGEGCVWMCERKTQRERRERVK